MSGSHKTGKRLLIASPLLLLAAVVAPHLFGASAYRIGRETALWIAGVAWFCLCVGGAIWSWEKD